MIPVSVFWPWFLSRLLIVVVMLGLAPHLPASRLGHLADWSVFAQWDGEWYEQIATVGYDYAADGQTHAIPFFPLYPMVSHALMQITGWRFAVAGTLVNNFAFLMALVVIYRWSKAQFGGAAADWTVRLMAWCPLSLYGTVTYTEGLFLLLTSLGLRSFCQGQFGKAGLFGLLTTATRLTGLPLVLAYLTTAYQDRWPRGAYWAAGISALGIGLYMVYCGLRFGDPIAFYHAQAAFGHRSAAGFSFKGWGLTLLCAIVGPVNWHSGAVKNIWHPIQFCAIEVGTYLLWRFRQRIKPHLPWLGFVLGIWFWLLAGDGAIKLIAVFGGITLLWSERFRLGTVLTHYGFWALALVLLSGSVVSADRYSYAIVSLSLALGLWLSRRPHWGTPILVGSGIILTCMAMRFAQGIWVA
jgi:Gpi18-like mannosyltransferase